MVKKTTITIKVPVSFKEILDKKAAEKLLPLSSFVTQVLLDSMSLEEKKEATHQEHVDDY